MASRTINEDTYAALVRAFTAKPGNFSHAARVADVSRPMATRAWKTGWPDIADWARPISELQGETETQARMRIAAAKMVREQDHAAEDAAERALVELDRVNQMVDEMRGVRSLQVVTSSAAAILSEMLEEIAKHLPRVRFLVTQSMESEGLSAVQILAVLGKAGKITKDFAMAHAATMDMQRVAEKDPVESESAQSEGVDDLPQELERYERTHARARRAVERAKALSLVVHKGGASV